MSDVYIAVAVSLPLEFFPDKDDKCWVAGKHTCRRLEAHLLDRRHTIHGDFSGGREEEWGISFESYCEPEKLRYDILYLSYPYPTRDRHLVMVVEYYPKPPEVSGASWFDRWFNPPPFRWLEAGHAMHETMREFGKSFEWFAMLTKSQLGDLTGTEYA
jgi:hypothetical protein